jgi:rubredoxin
MKAYLCSVCDYLYNDESAEKNNEGVAISFDQLPEDWVCPVCCVAQDFFSISDSERVSDLPENKK